MEESQLKGGDCPEVHKFEGGGVGEDSINKTCILSHVINFGKERKHLEDSQNQDSIN